MNPMSPRLVLSRKRRGLLLFILLTLVSLLGLGLAIVLPRDTAYILLPTLVAMLIFMLFLMILRSRVGDNLFGELGFLYMALALAYTLFPAFTFLIIDLDLASGWVWQNLTLLLPAPYELGLHLWRHVLFLFGVATGYLLCRGRKVPQVNTIKDPGKKDNRTIFFLIGIVIICIVCISMMSAPVNTYIDNYTRYDHLAWLPRKFVSLCNRMKQGLYVALIAFLFINFKKYKFTTYIIVAAMATYEVIFSYGSRIESLFVLLMAVCFYHYCVKPITLKKGLVACVAIAVLFSAVEIFRAYEFDVKATKSVVSARGLQPASEFGAVYFTGFHLYAERAKGTVPRKEWPMFFNDFISLVAPADFTRWHPQYWYARAYFPYDVVPPETMGPIAESAIWGGEFDLLLRSLINGAFFAFLVRWFITHRDKWWGIAVYAFCYATCIMTLKYSVFVQLAPLFKTFLPTIMMVEMFRKLIPSNYRSFVHKKCSVS